MHLHILGICGTFMGSLALLARELGHRVTGSDLGLYPPMSTQLAEAGIPVIEGWESNQLDPAPDLVVIGNALSRGNPAVEAVLNSGLAYTSGPQFLAARVLGGRRVLGVAGTHGKTTTASMLLHILQGLGRAPGFLIGGVPLGVSASAALGEGEDFVVEADEYDTAFFDKRSKFLHYRPQVLVINNLEFDHADIFPDLDAIQTQFAHLLRTVPATGTVICPARDSVVDEVLARGCWSRVQRLGLGDSPMDWSARTEKADASTFQVLHGGEPVGRISWQWPGEHSVHNALAAVAAAVACGVEPAEAVRVLASFAGVKRRLELLGQPGGVFLYDDFAHHPTAIRTTLEGLRARLGASDSKERTGRIIALVELRSNTMKSGYHDAVLPAAVAAADLVFWHGGEGAPALAEATGRGSEAPGSLAAVVQRVTRRCRPGDHLVVMSNGSFEGVHGLLTAALAGGASA